MVQVYICGRFLVEGHSTSEPPPYVWEIPTVCVFVGCRVTTELEKTDAHCSGHASHSCSNSEAFGVSSDGGAKKTGSRKGFSFLISALLSAENFLEWFQ